MPSAHGGEDCAARAIAGPAKRHTMLRIICTTPLRCETSRGRALRDGEERGGVRRAPRVRGVVGDRQRGGRGEAESEDGDDGREHAGRYRWYAGLLVIAERA